MIIEGGKVSKIKSVNNIPSVLKKLGMEVEPVVCGVMRMNGIRRENSGIVAQISLH